MIKKQSLLYFTASSWNGSNPHAPQAPRSCHSYRLHLAVTRDGFATAFFCVCKPIVCRHAQNTRQFVTKKRKNGNKITDVRRRRFSLKWIRFSTYMESVKKRGRPRTQSWAAIASWIYGNLTPPCVGPRTRKQRSLHIEELTVASKKRSRISRRPGPHQPKRLCR